MRRFGLAILGVWLATASCGDSTAPIGGGSETSAGTASSSSTTDPTPMVDSTASVDVTTLGEGSADGTSAGPECTLADVSVCDDGDPCTVDDCFDGMCTHEPEADGTACTGRDGNGGTCQDGECVTACAADRECDDRNPCTTDSCDPMLGQCVFEELDGVDAPASEQSDADCQVVECQAGVAVSEDDNADTPDDANDCTTDDCIAGTPTHDPFPQGTACGVDGLCDSTGACVDCISPDDCTDLPADDDCQTRTCTAGVCGQTFAAQGTAVNAALQTNANCQLIVCDGAGDMESVDDDTDLPVDGLECTDDVCNAGIPLNPDLPSGTTCSAGVCKATGDCVGCLTPADCGGTNTFCQTITCVGNLCGVDNTIGGIPLPVG